MEEQNQNWKDVVYEQDPEEKKQKKGRKKMPKRMKLVIGAAVAAVVLLPAAAGSFYQIQEQEQAVLVTFGKPKAVTETGLPHNRFSPALPQNQIPVHEARKDCRPPPASSSSVH